MVTQTTKTVAAIGTGAVAEALGGAGAVVLGILGLANIAPMDMAAAAIVVVGGALILEGVSVGSRWTHIRREARGTPESTELAVGGGVSAHVIGGLAGVVLGILSLLRIATDYLVPAAVIVFGVSLIMGSLESAKLKQLRLVGGSETESPEVLRTGLGPASGVDVMTGLAAIVLGVLGLMQIEPVLTSLVAILVVGLAVLVEGTSMGARALRAAT